MVNTVLTCAENESNDKLKEAWTRILMAKKKQKDVRVQHSEIVAGIGYFLRQELQWQNKFSKAKFIESYLVLMSERIK